MALTRYDVYVRQAEQPQLACSCMQPFLPVVGVVLAEGAMAQKQDTRESFTVVMPTSGPPL